jgi:hypothetical protein
VFASGYRDYRNVREISIASEFFGVNPGVLSFDLKLSVSQPQFDGREIVSSSGLSSLREFTKCVTRL